MENAPIFTDDIVVMLTANGFNERPAKNVAADFMHGARMLILVASNDRKSGDPVETNEGLTTTYSSRNTILVRSIDAVETNNPNLLDFDRAEKALMLIEDMIADRCKKQGIPVQVGSLLYEYLGDTPHVLTNAEESMLGKMRETTQFENEEDERETKEALRALEAELAAIPLRPRFRITKL